VDVLIAKLNVIGIQDLNDVAGIETRRALRLTVEMADIVSVCGEFRPKDSDGDIAISGLIAGAENYTMVPGAYPLQDQVSVFEYVALVEHVPAGRWGILRGDYTRYLRRATTTVVLQEM
jgi:hypothetical protein